MLYILDLQSLRKNTEARNMTNHSMKLILMAVLVFSGVAAAQSQDTRPSGYVVSYVKSDRQWRIGVQHQKYNQISQDFEDKLTTALNAKGLHQTPFLESGCCLITIELLEVTSHQAAFKKPGIDVSASVIVTDASGKFIYAKGYRGENRTLMGITPRSITAAVSDIVGNIMADENVTRVLATGKL